MSVFDEIETARRQVEEAQRAALHRADAALKAGNRQLERQSLELALNQSAPLGESEVPLYVLPARRNLAGQMVRLRDPGPRAPKPLAGDRGALQRALARIERDGFTDDVLVGPGGTDDWRPFQWDGRGWRLIGEIQWGKTQLEGRRVVLCAKEREQWAALTGEWLCARVAQRLSDVIEVLALRRARALTAPPSLRVDELEPSSVSRADVDDPDATGASVQTWWWPARHFRILHFEWEGGVGQLKVIASPKLPARYDAGLMVRRLLVTKYLATADWDGQPQLFE